MKAVIIQISTRGRQQQQLQINHNSEGLHQTNDYAALSQKPVDDAHMYKTMTKKCKQYFSRSDDVKLNGCDCEG